MRIYTAIFLVLVTTFAANLLAADKPQAKADAESPQQQYLDIFLADNSAEQGMDPDQKKAYEDQRVRDTCKKLEALQQKYPHWEEALVKRRLDYLHAQVAEMDKKQAAAEAAAEAGKTPEQLYLECYLKIQTAEHFEKDRDFANAEKTFREVADQLKKLQDKNPGWEASLIYHRLADCQAKINFLERKMAATSGAPVPAAVATPKRTPTDYPWKKDINATMFWIGQNGGASSAWDPNWTAMNGGEDSPNNRNGFTTAGHAGKVNPFYVALPFNDLAYPDKATKWVPQNWPHVTQNGRPLSACKNRWVQVKNADGKSCYAQWEDVGPCDKADAKYGDDDHAEYVFGEETLNPPGKPGIDVSPSVAQFIGLGKDNQPPVVSWRFVDDEDVPPGVWLKYDEQAVIYLAMPEHP